MNKKDFRYFYFLPIFFFAASLAAETAYVNDRLFLGVYAEPSSEQSAIHTLSSGSAIEVLERQDTFTKIQMPDGAEGWVRTRFISSDKPASVRIKEVEAERDNLSQQLKQAPKADEINALKSQLRKAQSTISTLQKSSADNADNNNTEVEGLKAELLTAQQKIQGLEQEVQTLNINKPAETVPVSNSNKIELSPVFAYQHWYWYLLSLFAILLIGFLIGASLLARRVRNRFSGIKVW